ncbi:MAG: type II toxin-antitoxin system RelB/DinJ family antitoxin [Spirochaetales bacterium]|nr:type II toxin-antitoxin system RelB/DinJ family antitoxin [Spirochaetales bacterium]
MANLTITIDELDKKEISEFCEQVGMTISGLYNVFTKQVLREGRIPFSIAVDRPNKKTIRAMREGDKMMAKYLKDPSSVKTYSVEELIEEMKTW